MELRCTVAAYFYATRVALGKLEMKFYWEINSGTVVRYSAIRDNSNHAFIAANGGRMQALKQTATRVVWCFRIARSVCWLQPVLSGG
ncbi:MAG TPA: hypothetical protein DCK99_00440 [Blastocatellia bacterium]|nr:hypothetical protein [Blastocatellia bacterium]